jgi:hypothetical protein
MALQAGALMSAASEDVTNNSASVFRMMDLRCGEGENGS